MLLLLLLCLRIITVIHIIRHQGVFTTAYHTVTITTYVTGIRNTIIVVITGIVIIFLLHLKNSGRICGIMLCWCINIILIAVFTASAYIVIIVVIIVTAHTIPGDVIVTTIVNIGYRNIIITIIISSSSGSGSSSSNVVTTVISSTAVIIWQLIGRIVER
ncbi:hypothetical protein O3M35_013315 [Rhynocoris fuscipes]|uniref:Uncharacterized protein n=1 Tax=Rhynocoris fuscipes TaxID=488301 RepID=A0AAW1CI28_9HEMI